eukprot:1570272-Rhodomonas_salina.3
MGWGRLFGEGPAAERRAPAARAVSTLRDVPSSGAVLELDELERKVRNSLVMCFVLLCVVALLVPTSSSCIRQGQRVMKMPDTYHPSSQPRTSMSARPTADGRSGRWNTRRLRILRLRRCTGMRCGSVIPKAGPGAQWSRCCATPTPKSAEIACVCAQKSAPSRFVAVNTRLSILHQVQRATLWLLCGCCFVGVTQASGAGALRGEGSVQCTQPQPSAR